MWLAGNTWPLLLDWAASAQPCDKRFQRARRRCLTIAKGRLENARCFQPICHLPPCSMTYAGWRPLYPFASQYLDLDGVRQHYVDEGQGPTILLVHGNPTWSFYWREAIIALRDRYRVIAMDHVGCGLSDKPVAYEYRLARHIENLQTLIQRLDLRDITLVGHDWGGCIGLGAAGRMPQRFARLVLSNTGAFRMDHIPWRIAVCRIPALGQLAVQGLNGFVRAALSMATTQPQRFTPEVRAGYLAPYNNWSNRIATHRFVLDIPLRPGHPSYATLVEVEQGLAELKRLPVLLAWGMRDWCFTPEFLARFQEFFPRAQTVRLASAGHFVVEDAREEWLAAVEKFLDEQPVAATP